MIKITQSIRAKLYGQIVCLKKTWQNVDLMIFISIVCGIAFPIFVQAASFNCNKSINDIEKIICSDKDISAMDEKLDALYVNLMYQVKNRWRTKKDQKKWLQKRNLCTNVKCLHDIYVSRIIDLQNKIENNCATTKNICEAIKNALDNGSINYSMPFYVRTGEVTGGSFEYQNVDIDLDGKVDELSQSCGSPGNEMCELDITLSGGGGYSFEDRPFRVIEHCRGYYILVGDTFPKQIPSDRQLYKLAKRGTELVCSTF